MADNWSTEDVIRVEFQSQRCGAIMSLHKAYHYHLVSVRCNICTLAMLVSPPSVSIALSTFCTFPLINKTTRAYFIYNFLIIYLDILRREVHLTFLRELL